MVRLITDSPADFEPFEWEQLKIKIIPLTVRLAETDYLDNVTLSKDDFFALLASTGASPTTSQPSPKLFADLIQEAREAGDEILYISMSSGISGTYQSACMTREDSEYEHCYVYDSLNATGGQRLIVEHAVRLRDQGKTAKEIMEGLDTIRDRIVLYACIDTLEYLYRGGRISHTVYKLGTMAQVKPIIRVSETGTIEVPAKAMGMRKGMDFLCKRLEAQKPDKNFPMLVMYTADRTIAETLAQKLRALGYDAPDDRIAQVGASIGSHIGPNACGVTYVAE